MPGSQHLTYLAGRVLPAVIGFIALISYSHLFDAGTYGEFAVLMGIANIVAGGLFIWIRTTLTRFGATGDARGARMTGVGLALHGFFSVTIAVVLGVVALLLQQTSVLLVALLIVAISWSDLNLDLLRSRHQARRYGIQYFIRQVLTVLSVILVMLMDVPSNPIALGFIVGNLISSLTLLNQVLPRPEYRFNRADVRDFVAYGFPLSINYAISSLTYTVDRLVISWLLGKEAAGIYALAADLVIQILGVLMDGVTLAFLPHAARALDRRGREAASSVLIQNLLVLLGLALPATLGLAVCGPYLALLVLGPEFGSGAQLLIPLLAVAFLLRGIRVYFVDNVLQIHHRSAKAAVATALNAAGLAALCVALVPLWGITGAALAAIIATAMAAGYGLVVARPSLSHSYPAVDVLKLLVASLATAGTAYVVLLFSTTLLGVAVAILAGAAIYPLAIWAVDPAGIRQLAISTLSARRRG